MIKDYHLQGRFFAGTVVMISVIFPIVFNERDLVHRLPLWHPMIRKFGTRCLDKMKKTIHVLLSLRQAAVQLLALDLYLFIFHFGLDDVSMGSTCFFSSFRHGRRFSFFS